MSHPDREELERLVGEASRKMAEAFAGLAKPLRKLEASVYILGINLGQKFALVEAQEILRQRWLRKLPYHQFKTARRSS
jgi:hypothetical protein